MSPVPEKPSLDDALMHYGVKGMRWGHHKSETSGGSGGGPDTNKRGFQKKYSTSDIKSARLRTRARENQIREAEDRLHLSDARGDNKGARKAAGDYQKAVNDYLTSKDYAVSSRLTRGEKVSTILLAGPFAALPLAAAKANTASAEKKTVNNRKAAGLKD